MSLNPVDRHILEILRSQHETLVTKTTDIVFASGEVLMDRATTEQLLRGNLAIIEEVLLGESTDLRTMYLETALPEVARVGPSTWRTVLSDGLPCWGIIVGLVAIQADEAHQLEVVHRLSRIMGTWWGDVWDSMSPVYKSKGAL